MTKHLYPIHYAHTAEQLKQHVIKVGPFEIQAQANEENQVWWPLPGKRITYNKNEAREVAAAASKLMLKGDSHGQVTFY